MVGKTNLGTTTDRQTELKVHIPVLLDVALEPEGPPLGHSSGEAGANEDPGFIDETGLDRFVDGIPGIIRLVAVEGPSPSTLTLLSEKLVLESWEVHESCNEARSASTW